MFSVIPRQMTAVLTAACFLCQFTFAEATDEPAMTIRWNELKYKGNLKSGEVVSDEKTQTSHLKISNDAKEMKVFPLCEIDAPPVSTPSYAIRGKVRYQNVTGNGFLEMWNHFNAGEAYFSRTMDTGGPMGMVTGSSSERDFILPFHTGGKVSPPKKLVLNLVLNGPGTVEIGPMELIGITAIPIGSGASWWDGPTGGVIGGIGGSLVGLAGGLIGTLVSLGKGKRFVIALSATILMFGAILFVTGVAAITQGQPFEVFGVLFLLGGIMSFAGIMILAVAPIRYRAFEMRKMQALDS